MMGLPRRLTVLIITFLLIILATVNLNLSFVGLGAPSNSKSLDTGGYILKINDYGMDENNDTSYDILSLKIRLNLSATGNYGVYATMVSFGIKANDFIVDDFDPGEHIVELELDGDKIYESARNGPYTIALSVYKDNNLLVELEYTTKEYDFEEFNPTPPLPALEKASIEVINNTIKLKTKIFTAVIYEQNPMIVFYYSTDDGLTARFKVSYHRIIGFYDRNQDGEFQEGELKYYGDLVSSRWNSMKVLMENFNSFDFRVETIVDLVDTTRAQVGTKLKVAFHYSSTTKLDSPETTQKFDISINVLGDPLEGITHLSVEHALEDLTANHEFFEVEEDHKISFITPDGKEHGYYKWTEKMEAKIDTGVRTEQAVSYNLELSGESTVRRLYLNYPYSSDIIEMLHDPVVGVNPSNQPEIPNPPKPEIIRHEVILYIIAAIVAAVIMFGSIYRQRKRNER